MNKVLILLTVQALLGSFDNLWHHELSEGLPAKRSARLENALHAARELLYAILFVAIAWWQWHGAWSLWVGVLLLVEIGITLTDFVVEDATRRLPRSERVLHTILAINIGAVLTLLAPILLDWGRAETAVVFVDYGLGSRAFTVFGAGVSLFGLRDAYAAWRGYQPPVWQRIGLSAGKRTDARRILVTGATGFIGRHLVWRLIARGDRVTVLARHRDKAEDLFGAHVAIVTRLSEVVDADAIINLAGAPIAAWPWTKRRRQALLGSRLGVTAALLELVERLEHKPTTWINASAIGYYGTRNDDLALHEKCPSGSGFQAELCRRWEDLAARAALVGVKTTWLRIGLVLDGRGGALPALARPVRFRLGCLLGDARQWVSWIHLDDLLGLVLFVLDERNLAGPINATAPTPVPHAALMRAIAAVLGRPLLPVAVPALALRAGLGELAELFVAGQRVTPNRALALGFEFEHCAIDAAVAAALGRPAIERACQTRGNPGATATARPD